MEITQVIRNFIVENFLFEDDPDLKTDTSFLENGIVDSTGILELVDFVEKKFDILVADDELVPENFDTIASIARYIEMKRTGSTKEREAVDTR